MHRVNVSIKQTKDGWSSSIKVNGEAYASVLGKSYLQVTSQALVYVQSLTREMEGAE